MSKKAILFVDDEPNILSGLKRMLRSMRKGMNFHFAEDGPAALEIMATENIDVVVSDMRMPGMDGATLLANIQKQYPHAIRIMLTGQADDDSIMRTVGVVHQFLAKPADPELLKQVIERAAALQDLMTNERLKNLVSSIDSLPSLPETYARLQEVINDPDSGLGEVAAIIEHDLAMSAKVLQLVNSAFFGLYQHIESPSRAVNLLGLDTIKALVLGIGVFSAFETPSSKVFNIRALWSHSLSVAAFAKKIALQESEDKKLIDDTFIAALLHDVGKLILFSRMPEEYEQAILFSQEKGTALTEAEQQIFQARHCDIGAYLIGLWGLPGPVVEAIAFHHRLDDYPEMSFCPALIVHAADAIFYQLNQDAYPGGELPQLNTSALELSGMSEKIADWTELCREIQAQGEEDDE